MRATSCCQSRPAFVLRTEKPASRASRALSRDSSGGRMPRQNANSTSRSVVDSASAASAFIAAVCSGAVAPPSSSYTGLPSAFPAMSQQAVSTAAKNSSMFVYSMNTWRRRRSTSKGDWPWMSGPMPSSRTDSVAAGERNVRISPQPAMPSSVSTRTRTRSIESTWPWWVTYGPMPRCSSRSISGMSTVVAVTSVISIGSGGVGATKNLPSRRRRGPGRPDSVPSGDGRSDPLERSVGQEPVVVE